MNTGMRRQAMKRHTYIIVFGITLLMITSIIPFISQVDKKNEYNYCTDEYGNYPDECGNYPAEYTGIFIRTKENPDNEYYILADNKNGTSKRLMEMYLENVVIQNSEKEDIPLSDICTGDTIKVNYNGDIVACYPELITKIQSVTLIKRNSEADVEALLELIPNKNSF